MKRTFFLFSIISIAAVLIAACAPQVPAEVPQAPPPTMPPQPTPAPALPSIPAAQPTAGAEASPAAPAAAAHERVPGELPAGKGIFLGDQSTVSSANKARALVGDRFAQGKFERPYNANSMDTYFPYLDIVSGNFYTDAIWSYARITMVGPDPSAGFPAKYAVEVDKNMDGRGDMLVIADHPASKDWTTDGVQVLEDQNKDIGGVNAVIADSAGKAGDGYETVVFNAGQGEDPDAAWVRLSPSDPNSLELAFKTSLLGGDKTWMAGLWAGTDSLNPALFDLDDHFTHEQAGDPNSDSPLYPIKELAELDNTCRAGIGFTPSGHEPAICSQGG